MWLTVRLPPGPRASPDMSLIYRHRDARPSARTRSGHGHVTPWQSAWSDRQRRRAGGYAPHVASPQVCGDKGKENVLRPARGMKIAVAFMASGLTLAAAACGTAPSSAPGSTASAAKEYNACMVTDKGGLDDKSFNASAWQGMKDAEADPSTNIKVQNVASTSQADYEPNLATFVNKKCDFILAVGGLMGDATKKIALANPKQQFAIVDSSSAAPNIYPMQFDTAQAGFLAGYLAAGYSKSGK